MNWLSKLRALLRASDLRVTFDLERDVTKPCFTCGSEAEPRVLRVVGSYLNEHRDDMVRPLCPRCALK